ncbi:Txe/YoeB family addiction module toxin [Mucilaginibacter psychrotolerans]|uniref:Putative mRNA interferase YoeB n=1 Tax=Mucilaginibacter psychrotolerans TaxID=1524096 RepID=A0A4Y8SMY7_9SPHI|nr:Txe/YoeB family addiction module toxin [Mucilaginibacter psychrotolerans]TFF40409.1 Txe/YoeB family addiction module toxin [Mucilaginibacter psychrotolerans]
MDKALADLIYWKKSGNIQAQKKITQLIQAIQENPFTGIGQPEELKYNWAGLWSRRINLEHRIIYEVLDDSIIVHSLRGHY